MGNLTIIDKIRIIIGDIGFRLFLWANNMTDVEYWDYIVKTENDQPKGGK